MPVLTTRNNSMLSRFPQEATTSGTVSPAQLKRLGLDAMKLQSLAAAIDALRKAPSPLGKCSLATELSPGMKSTVCVRPRWWCCCCGYWQPRCSDLSLPWGMFVASVRLYYDIHRPPSLSRLRAARGSVDHLRGPTRGVRADRISRPQIWQRAFLALLFILCPCTCLAAVALVQRDTFKLCMVLPLGLPSQGRKGSCEDE